MLKEIIAKAKALGGAVETRLGGVNVDPPRGYHWVDAPGCSALAGSYRRDSTSDAAACYKDLLERMALGLEKCDDPYCEVCHPD